MKEPSALAKEGLLLLSQGREDEAVERFEAGLQANPAEPDCLRGALAAAALSGETQQAEAYARRLLAVQPEDADAEATRAFAGLERAPARALATLRQLAELPHSSALARLLYARALVQEGELEAAEAAFERAVAVEPKLPAAYFDAADAAFGREAPEAAVAWLKRLAERRPEVPGVYEALAEAHEALGDYERAEEALQRASAQNPEDTSLLERRYDLAFEASRFEQALELTAALLAQVPRDPEYRFMRGQALARLGRREEAKRELQAVALANPEAAEPLVALAELAYEQEDDPDAAIHLLQRALQRAPDDIGAANDLANIYLELDEPEKVEPVLKAVLEAHPGEPISCFNMTMALLKSEPQRAAAFAREVIDSGHPQLAPEAEKLLASLK